MRYAIDVYMVLEKGVDIEIVAKTFHLELTNLSQKYDLDSDCPIVHLYALQKEGKIVGKDLKNARIILAYALSTEIGHTTPREHKTTVHRHTLAPTSSIARDFLKFYRKMDSIQKTASLSVLRPIITELKKKLRDLAKSKYEEIAKMQAEASNGDFDTSHLTQKYSNKMNALFDDAAKKIEKETQDWKFVHNASKEDRKKILANAIKDIEIDLAMLVSKTISEKREQGGLVGITKNNVVEFIEIESVGVLSARRYNQVEAELDIIIANGGAGADEFKEQMKKILLNMMYEKETEQVSSLSLLIAAVNFHLESVLAHIQTKNALNIEKAKNITLRMYSDIAKVQDTVTYVPNRKRELEVIIKYNKEIEQSVGNLQYALEYESDHMMEKLDYATRRLLPDRFLGLHTHPDAPKSYAEARLHLEYDMQNAKKPGLMICPLTNGFAAYYYTDTEVEYIGNFLVKEYVPEK